ncbi:uncharacterized protein PFL1_00106 [Pseudozyma flocculosa PF-1]|uniref:Related to PHO84 - high-affinity inorganic phosphate transporter n=1 Tax=Pseudozyma flocculosa TaxID=84751 RepID=A0A5C3EVR2_9BASI|nr:uncharacterized protein PFL1_00106 [Pseudozyma flocculosa PF-1]EPQ31907.1 hypothetical protein PFL1_00106 [Pseudozyma flocculosa PF-1]SPO35181.1 related to PHO84 - high-affinity inorganic phosphate transporter [Pseudozyma flocculosa]
MLGLRRNRGTRTAADAADAATVATSDAGRLSDGSLDSEVAKMAAEMGVDASYERKVALLNKAIKDEIGFGKFQLWVTFLAGGGWAIDNFWFQALGMGLPQIELEFEPEHIQFAALALYSGLLVGATVWGILSDIIGRKVSWNVTLLLSGILGVAVGGAPNFVGLGGLLGALGVGVGGQLPIDGVMLIEFLPASHYWILTFLSVFWCLGQLFAAVMGWAFITNFRCETADACPKSSNMGWRYTWFVLGGVTLVMWAARFFIYPIPESPKFLIANGRDEEALEVLRFIAKENGKTTTLTLAQLKAAGEGATYANKQGDEEAARGLDATPDEKTDAKLEAEVQLEQVDKVESSSPLQRADRVNLQQLRRSLSQFDTSHIRALFSSPKMAWNTSLICFLWGLIGLAYPLYNVFVALYLKNAGAASGGSSQAEQYRDLVIIAACGIPGSFFAAAMVELPYAGRKGTMALFTLLTGVFLFLFTTARTPQAILGWNCATSLSQNAMYSVLYAMSYEVFPAPHRGTGDGLAMATQRVFGVAAPVVGAFAGDKPDKPIYISASFFIAAAALMLFLPYETRGRAAL